MKSGRRLTLLCIPHTRISAEIHTVLFDHVDEDLVRKSPPGLLLSLPSISHLVRMWLLPLLYLSLSNKAYNLKLHAEFLMTLLISISFTDVQVLERRCQDLKISMVQRMQFLESQSHQGNQNAHEVQYFIHSSLIITLKQVYFIFFRYQLKSQIQLFSTSFLLSLCCTLVYGLLRHFFFSETPKLVVLIDYKCLLYFSELLRSVTMSVFCFTCLI